MNHLTVLYPPRNFYDEKNNAIWAGGPGGLVKHRTIDLLSVDEWTVETIEFGTPFIRPAPDTRIWCLGEAWLKSLFNDPNLHKARGYRLSYSNTQLIATYTPIDCWLFKSAEGDDDEAGDDNKDVGVTRRANYLFWCLADFAKLLRDPSTPRPYQAFGTIHPAKAADWLLHLPTNTHLILDIETRHADHVLDCIGLGWIKSDGTIVSFAVAFYCATTLANSQVELGKFWRALYHVFRRPDITVVGHNLAFDLSILHHYYHLPIPRRVFDTMLFMQRHWPGVDKSLSHAISYYTDSTRNHKGDIAVNSSAANLERLINYNGQDIRWTAEVMLGQRRFSSLDRGLANSADIANRMQVLAFNMSFTGILVDVRVAESKKADVALRLKNLKRIISILVGRPDFNPNSADQCADYLITELKYPVLEETETGLTRMSTPILYQMQLKQVNPLIPLIIQYRETQKELSMIEFENFKQNEFNV